MAYSRLSKMIRFGAWPIGVAALGLLAASATTVTPSQARDTFAARISSRVFVFTHLGLALDPHDAEDCPHGFSPGPDVEAALKTFPPEKQKELRDPNNYQKMLGSLSFRGPGGANVCAQPTLVGPNDPDATYYVAEGTRGLGFNLDGDDGTGAPAPGTCAHKNLVGPNGETGIDNQQGRLMGCIMQQRRDLGYVQHLSDEAMLNGGFTIVLQVSGIDDPMNDDSVDILLTGSNDPMKKVDGIDSALKDYSFHLIDDPQVVNHLHGKIVNGTVTIDPVPELRLYTGGGAYNGAARPRVRTITTGHMSFKMADDGTVTGLIGGYERSRYGGGGPGSRTSESLNGPFRCPGRYYAMKREADGGYDPKTGECTTMSEALLFEGVRAFAITDQKTASAK